jgi:hypothetical protein
VKQSAYTKARDTKIADSAGVDPGLMCPAHGCPNRWNVEGVRGRACAAHYWADRAEWPRVTEDVQRAEVQRALDKANEPLPVALTRKQRSAILGKLSEIGSTPRSAAHTWAYDLRDRHRAGARLTPAQVTAFSAVLDRVERPLQDAAGSFDMPLVPLPMPPALDLPPIDAYANP